MTQQNTIQNDISTQIAADIAANPVILYMKGTPQAPMCGFSGTVIAILNRLGAPYKGVNVLADEAVREGIKEYSQWPTIPQLYIGGTFIGGCDIVREMYASGELQQALDDAAIPCDPQE